MKTLLLTNQPKHGDNVMTTIESAPIINSIEQAGMYFNTTFCHSMAIQMGSISSELGKIICLIYGYNEQFFHVMYIQNDWFYPFEAASDLIPEVDKGKVGQFISMGVLEHATNLNASIIMIARDSTTYITKAVDAMAYVLAYDTQRRVNIHQLAQEGGIPQAMLKRLRVGDIDYIK